MKNKLLMIIIMFNVIISFGQVPSWSWVETAGSNIYNESAVSMTTDNNGNIIVVGQFGGSPVTFGTTTLNNVNSNGSNDIFIVKYDSIGNVIWAKSAGGLGDDVPSSLKTDAFGNIVLAGSFEGTVVFGSTILFSTGLSDIFIAKYDSLGNVIWAKSAGSTNIDQVSSIYIDFLGDISAVGWYKGGVIVFGNDTLENNTSSSNNMFVTKYDSNGNALWAKQAASTSKANSVCTDSIGNIYVAGNFNDNSIVFGADTLINIVTGYPEIFIVKYNYNGVVEWSKSFKGIYDDYATSIICDNNQNIYVAGYFGSPTIFIDSTTLTNNGDHDIFLIKLNSSGNILSSRSDGGTSYDQTNSISIDATGNIYLAGYFGSSLPTTMGAYILSNNGAFDVFVTKYDGNLNVLWAKSVGGINDEQIKSITSFSSGSIYVSGFFASNSIAFDSIIANNTGFNDIFVAKLSEPLNTQCQAYFTYYPDSVEMGSSGSYAFFDYSQNNDSSQINVVSWNWTISGIDTSFTSNEQNPVFYFNSAGVYSVCLNIVTTGDCSSSYCDTLTIDSCNIIITGEVTNCSSANSSDGAIDITVIGGVAPYFFSWSDSSITEDLAGLYSGFYSVDVFDANGCSISGQFNVEVENDSTNIDSCNIAIYDSITNCSSANSADGSIDLFVTGGVSPYLYSWSDSTFSEDLLNVYFGLYSVEVIDANGCVAYEQFYVGYENDSVTCNLSATYNVVPVSYIGANDGSINVTVFNGTSPYTYLWTNGATTEDINNLTSGAYSVTIFDANPACPTVELYAQLYEPYDENGGPLIDSLFTNTIDTCFGTIDSFYVSNVEVVGGNTIVVTWNFVSGSITFTVNSNYLGYENGSYAIYITINCESNKALATYMSYIHVETLTTDIIENSQPLCKLYPNPVKDFLNVELNNLSADKVEIFGINGQMIYSENNIQGNDALRINTQNLERGMYIVRLTNQTESYTYRFVK